MLLSDNVGDASVVSHEIDLPTGFATYVRDLFDSIGRDNRLPILREADDCGELDVRKSVWPTFIVTVVLEVM